MTNSQSDERISQDAQTRQGGQTIIINQTGGNKNSLGTAGFVLALLGVVFCWVPVLDWILWILGLILSFIGVFKEPRGLSIAGLCLSVLGLLLIVVLLSALAALVAAV
jgi:hypothetical protein